MHTAARGMMLKKDKTNFTVAGQATNLAITSWVRSDLDMGIRGSRRTGNRNRHSNKQHV
jgi:hypothetical protein